MVSIHDKARGLGNWCFIIDSLKDSGCVRNAWTMSEPQLMGTYLRHLGGQNVIEANTPKQEATAH